MNITEETFKEITEEELTQIETMAGLFFDLEEIVISLNWGELVLDEFKLIIQMKDFDNKAYIAYFKGRLASEIELRQSIKQAAKNGSNPAQNTLLEFAKNSQV